MSFRFRVLGESWQEEKDKLPLRTISEVELYEVGPVVWPAYDATSVGVRSREVAAILDDTEARQELAKLMLSGTDRLRSLADGEPPASSHGSPTPDAPAHGHAEETPTPPVRDHRARMALAFADF